MLLLYQHFCYFWSLLHNGDRPLRPGCTLDFVLSYVDESAVIVGPTWNTVVAAAKVVAVVALQGALSVVEDIDLPLRPGCTPDFGLGYVDESAVIVGPT